MEKNVNFILTSQEYFDIVNYDYQELREKVAYTLFYVTQVAQLRKDMIPKILADRIWDQYKLYIARVPLKPGESVEVITEEKVNEVILNNPNYFGVSSGVIDMSDRKNGEIAYVLTKSKSDELMSEFNKNIRDQIKKSGRKALFERGWMILILIAFLTFGMYQFWTNNRTGGMRDLSIREYAKTLNFEKYNEGKQGVFFVYYITELIGLREDISPSVVNDRIRDMGYKTLKDDELATFFDQSPYVTKSPNREGAYIMTSTGISMVEEEMVTNASKESVTIDRDIFMLIISLIISAAGLLISASYKAGSSFK